MKTVIVVSKCTKIAGCEATFNFRGYYYGLKIKKILIVDVASREFLVGDEYILYVGILRITETALTGIILRSKRLESITI